MNTRNIQTAGLITLIVAAALSVDTGHAARKRLSAAASTTTGHHLATPRARPDVRIARLQENDHFSGDSMTEPALPHVRLPRPRPQYFDLRIDMTDMLGEEDLAGPGSESRIVEARRPSDGGLQDIR